MKAKGGEAMVGKANRLIEEIGWDGQLQLSVEGGSGARYTGLFVDDVALDIEVSVAALVESLDEVRGEQLDGDDISLTAFVAGLSGLDS